MNALFRVMGAVYEKELVDNYTIVYVRLTTTVQVKMKTTMNKLMKQSNAETHLAVIKRVNVGSNKIDTVKA